MVAHLAPQGPRLRPGQGEAVAPPRAPAARSGEERGLLSLGKARPVVQNLHLKAFLLQEAETHLALGRPRAFSSRWPRMLARLSPMEA